MKTGKVYEPYNPKKGSGVSVAGPVEFNPQPKMYGGAEAAIAGSDTTDYTNNGVAR